MKISFFSICIQGRRLCKNVHIMREYIRQTKQQYKEYNFSSSASSSHVDSYITRRSPPTPPSRPCSQLYPYLPSASKEGYLVRESYPGGRKCTDKNCQTCPWLREGPNFSHSITKRKYKFMTPSTCTDTGLVYLVTCSSCRYKKDQLDILYCLFHDIGSNMLERLSNHWGKLMRSIRIISSCRDHSLAGTLALCVGSWTGASRSLINVHRKNWTEDYNSGRKSSQPYFHWDWMKIKN